MVLYTLEQRWKVGLRLTYRRCQFWQKKKIIFSDEAHFDLGGYVNKQNCRIWGTENPHAYIEKPKYPKRITVWCGFWSRGIIGPFFFANEQGELVTVNGDRYRAMLNEFLFTKIEVEDIANIWLQQDGATCHTPEAKLDVLSPVFEDCRPIFQKGFHDNFINSQSFCQKPAERKSPKKNLFIFTSLFEMSDLEFESWSYVF